MPGNPKPRLAPVRPIPHFLAIPDDPYIEHKRAKEQQADQTDEPGHAVARPGMSLQHAKAAVLADFLWKRHEPGRSRPGPLNGKSDGRRDSGDWQDQQLAEVQDLAENLRQKVARYSTLRAGLFSAEAPEPANETAVLWIQEALEDIAATALGIQITSRELFLQAASAGEPDSQRDTAKECSVETGE